MLLVPTSILTAILLYTKSCRYIASYSYHWYHIFSLDKDYPVQNILNRVWTLWGIIRHNAVLNYFFIFLISIFGTNFNDKYIYIYICNFALSLGDDIGKFQCS